MIKKRAPLAVTREDLKGENLESYKVIEAEEKLENKIKPRLDYSDPANFVTYGSAEEYYTAGIDNITNIYPYDGSKYERTEWHVSGSGLDNYLFDNRYPRRNGHITLSHDGWSTPADSLDEFFLPTDKEYITIKGGPNTDNTAQNLASLFPSDSGKANIIDSSENQEANLTLGGGNTVEFWMKKDSFPHPHEVVLDVVATGSALSDRFCIYLTSSGEVGVKYKVGASDFENTYTATTLTDDTWHHYAISITATGTGSLYVDGKKSGDSKTGGDATVKAETPLIASIGSYMSASAFDDTAFPTDTPGWCKLSASLDEFRFWKTARTAEEIGLNWNTQVYGGTNTDTANTDLGVYYKFNEGIMGTSKDATVLDYSGRISNGAWTGYASGARSLTSAMVESGASAEEFKDPIVYATNPDVMTLRENLRLEGIYYDQQNNASLYNSIPSYIREEDGAQQNLLKLTQIMSSYLDSLQASIGELNSMKDVSYPSGSESAFPFAQRNLQNLGFSAEDFFIDATVLEKFMHKNNTGELEYKLSEIKNLIYQNIYNNLAFIAESKGTEKSFRNLARCFGVDDRLLKLNIYSNNEEYKLEDKYNDVVIKTNTIDFDDPSRFEATMFQTSSGETPSSSFLTGSSFLNPSRDLNGITLEADIIFPQKAPKTSPFYFDTPFTKSSLFGLRYTAGEDNFDWYPSDPDISVYAVREDRNSKNAYFELSSSYLDVVLTSSIFEDVYSDERWNLAVKVRNDSHHTTALGTYTIELQGVNSDGDRIDNSFLLSHEFTSGLEIWATISSARRVYAGALRTDTTGSVVEKADTRMSAVRYWGKYLTDDTIINHAKDATSYGVKDANRPLFGSDNGMPAIDTLQLYWGFDSVTTSSATGEFDILDLSSGSASKAALYGDFGDFHPGTGYDFPADTTVVNKEYVNTLVRVNPENSNGADMVKVLTQAEEIKQEFSNPTNLVFSIEKSLYQEISDEMLKFFSTSADLASLCMKPTDKYNTSNHELVQIRNVFFDRMENSPDVSKFYEYFKWIDDAVVTMLRQQLPAAAPIMDGSVNIIESHILERNKVLYKTPTYAASKSPIYEGSISTPNTERTD